MHGFVSYQRFGRALSLRAWLELGRYVATEHPSRSVTKSSVATSLARARSLRSDQAWLELGRYVATERDGCSVAT
ncbi:hypothetical protein F2Q69_00014852 [Brassica cretica]|uniref:Uncharacterized protein n=1 Tax=Brassica cretica TaxID=69181 RepID=A0A8S9QR63_BRACR|nr:hypothetical protein F2Q69_00014852 [Brassica cretica]